jgi:hypothetical protein
LKACSRTFACRIVGKQRKSLRNDPALVAAEQHQTEVRAKFVVRDVSGHGYYGRKTLSCGDTLFCVSLRFGLDVAPDKRACRPSFTALPEATTLVCSDCWLHALPKKLRSRRTALVGPTPEASYCRRNRPPRPGSCVHAKRPCKRRKKCVVCGISD